MASSNGMTKKRSVLVSIPLKPEQKMQLEDLGFEILSVEKDKKQGPWRGVEVLVAFDPFRHLRSEDLPDLAFLQLVSTGVNHVPEDIWKRDVMVSNHYGGYAVAIGEFVVARILEIYKKLDVFRQLQRERKWEKQRDLRELSGAKALFLGSGTLARESAIRLKAFGVHCAAISRSGTWREPFDEMISREQLLNRVPDMDLIINCLPETAETDHFVNEEMLRTMKEGSLFLNVSRGNSVDEEALLRYGDKFLGVVLDVFSQEPLAENHPFWSRENFYLSPHSSFASQKVEERRFALIRDNLARYARGEKPRFLVDSSRGY